MAFLQRGKALEPQPSVAPALLRESKETVVSPEVMSERKEYAELVAGIVGPEMASRGIPSPRDLDLTGSLHAYGPGLVALVWVYRAVRIIADTISSLEVKMFERRGEEVEEITDHPAIELLRRINPRDTFRDHAEATSSFLDLTGNAFWLAEGRTVNGTGPPTEVWTVRPDIVTIHPTRGGEIAAYSILPSPSSKPIPYPASDVIHFKLFNPTNIFWGMTPLMAAWSGLRADYFSRTFNERFFKHGAKPSGVITYEGALEGALFERVKQQIIDLYGGVENSHKPMLLENNLKWNSLSIPQRDMEFLEQRKWTKAEVAAAYGIPPIKLSDYSDASVLSNARVQERAFWMDAIIPRLSKWVSVLNERYLDWFMPGEAADSPFFFAWDLDGVDALREDDEVLANMTEKLVNGNNPILTPDEARKRYYDMAPLEDGTGGVRLVPNNLIAANLAVSGEAQQAALQGVKEGMSEAVKEWFDRKGKEAFERLVNGSAAGVDPDLALPELKDEEDEDFQVEEDESPWGPEPDIPTPSWAQDRRAEAWRVFAKQLEPLERRFAISLVALFRSQRDEVLRNIDKVLGDLERRGYVKQSGDPWPVSPEAFLFEPEVWDHQFREELITNYGFVINDFLPADFKRFGLINPVDVKSPVILDATREFAERFSPSINRETARRLVNILRPGLQLGESIPKLKKRVQGVFAGTVRATGKRAQMIARTESVRAANLGRNKLFEANRDVIEGREWAAQLDARTDEVCASLDGMVTGLREPFEGGIDSPPDPHPNCLHESTKIRGAVVAASKSFYSGKMIEVRTLSGERLTVTPNHPVLTTEGFVPAGQVVKGDCLVCYGGGTESGLSDPDKKDRPLSVEEVFDAIKAGGLTSRQPVSPGDLHGEGKSIKGQIEVVRAHGMFEVSCDRVIFQEGVSDFQDAVSDASFSEGPGPGSLNSFRHGDLSSPDGGPSGTKKGFDSLFGVPGSLDPAPPVLHGLASVSDGDASLFKSALQDAAGEAGIPGELLERASFNVSLDEVIEVRDFYFSGHVYDLQTTEGVIISQSAILKNCRCAIIPVVRDVPGKAEPEGYEVPEDVLTNPSSMKAHLASVQAQVRKQTGVSPEQAKAMLSERNLIYEKHLLDEKRLTENFEAGSIDETAWSEGLASLEEARETALRALIDARQNFARKLGMSAIGDDVSEELVSFFGGTLRPSATYRANGDRLASRLAKSGISQELSRRMMDGLGAVKVRGRKNMFRAYYNPKDHMIMGHPGISDGTLLHEYAHALEAGNPSQLRASILWRDQLRAPGESPRRLSSIYPGHGYRSDEIAVQDEFKNAYTGKIYRTSAFGAPEYGSEVLSMGFQNWASPEMLLEFYASDPDHFAFTWSSIRGDFLQ